MKRKLLVTAAGALVLAAAAVPGVASADHLHSKEVGNGNCVVLAQNGGENLVVLPDQNPHITDQPENRRHPLHVLVHLGEPGENFSIGVLGTASDPCIACGEYLNSAG